MKFISIDNKEFEFTKEMCKKSVLLSQLIDDDSDNENDSDDKSIPNLQVDYDTLFRIKDFLNYRIKNGPMNIIKQPLESNDLSELVSEFDFKFVNKLNFEELENLTNAANYLYIEDLLNLCCAKWAIFVKGKTHSELEKLIGKKIDFSEEEKNILEMEKLYLKKNN